MRRFSAIVAAIAVATVAAQASATESTIVPGVGIGKVKLGMTKAQVEHVLGRDPLLNDQDGAFSEYAWDFASWTVGFRDGRAVQIATTLAVLGDSLSKRRDGRRPARSTALKSSV